VKLDNPVDFIKINIKITIIQTLVVSSLASYSIMQPLISANDYNY